MTKLFLSKGDTPPAEDQQIVWAEVYAPNRPDSGGDFTTAEEIRKMAYHFVSQGRMGQIDVMHDNVVIKACVIESFIARDDDPTFIPGSWVVGVHIEDAETWSKVKKGDLNGFSMDAFASVQDVEVTIEIPPVISGDTSREQDHVHKFYVSYDEDGKFLGGKTNVVDGHFHEIWAGTVSQEANGHTHRFSSVDDLLIVPEQL